MSVLEVLVGERRKGGVFPRTGVEIEVVFFRGKARLFRPPPGAKREQPCSGGNRKCFFTTLFFFLAARKKTHPRKLKGEVLSYQHAFIEAVKICLPAVAVRAIVL